MIGAQSLPSHAQSIGNIIFRADTYKTDFSTGITKGNGNVKIQFDDKVITADSVEIESKISRIRGIGNVVFVTPSANIKAEEMDFDSKTGQGVFKNAILKKGTDLHIEARSLSRVDDFKYLAREVKLTTCLDCPQSWSVAGSYAEVEVEAYAEIHHALLQIKDSPILYFPIFVFPIKTKRQSGFLTPKLFTKSSDLGFRLRVPYYWAPKINFDMTSTYDFSTDGGHRLSNEVRYQHSDRSFLVGQFGYGRNHSLLNVPQDRYGFSFEERYQINSAFTQRMRGELSSDTLYATHYADEFQSGMRPFLANEPSVSYQNHRFAAYGLLRFHKDNITRNIESVSGIDRLPEFSLYQPYERVWGPFMAEWETQALSLRRRGSVRDDFSGWIREGDRLGVQARLFMNSSFLSALRYEPEIFVRADMYQFPTEIGETLPRAYRARIVLGQKLSSQIFRIYNVEDSQDLRAVKHSVEPRISWSYAPPEARTLDHDFFSNPRSPRFDLFDPDSPDAQQLTLGTVSEEQKLRKHHILTLGLDSKVVGRFGDSSRRYEEFFTFTVDQDFNLATYQEADGTLPKRLSPLKIAAVAQYGGLTLRTSIAYDYSDTGYSDVKSDISYTWSRYTFVLKQTLGSTNKTTGAQFVVRNYGPWSFDLNGDYDLIHEKLVSQSYLLSYASPSKCWYFSLKLFILPNQADPNKFNFEPFIAPIFGAAISGKFL